MKDILSTPTSDLIRMRMSGESLEPLIRSANETNPDEYLPAMATASLGPQKTYLHIGDGHTSFDPSKIDLKNTWLGKPGHTLFGSEFIPEGIDGPYGQKYYSDWDLWTADEGWGADEGMTYTYKPEARVYYVKGYNDFMKIPDKYWIPDISEEFDRRLMREQGSFLKPIKKLSMEERKNLYEQIKKEAEQGLLDTSGFKQILDYEKLAKDWDAIDFSQEFAKKAAEHRKEQYSKRIIPPLSTSQTILLNPDMITGIKPWYRPHGEYPKEEPGQAKVPIKKKVKDSL